MSSADVDLPAGPLMTAEDPRNCHRVGQIVSGALYELLVSLCRRGITLPAARDAVGALMLRALTFVPEHRVSLRDYACALVRADGLLLDSACGEALAAVLARRGLVGGSGEARSARLPEFRLAPDLTDSEAILLRLEELERAQLRRVEAIEWTCREERNLVPLLRHRATAFVAEEVGRDELALLEDTTTSDGLRILRLGYRRTQAVVEDHDDSGIPRAQQARTACEGYASLVFDAEGTLVDFHADRPLE